MLQVILCGNLGHDAESRVSDGQKYVSFRVAHSQKTTNPQSGEITETTDWVQCTMQGGNENLLPFLKTGTKVIIIGDISQRIYKSTRDGQMKAGLNCRVRKLELCSSALSRANVLAYLNALPSNERQAIINECVL